MSAIMVESCPGMVFVQVGVGPYVLVLVRGAGHLPRFCVCWGGSGQSFVFIRSASSDWARDGLHLLNGHGDPP